MQQIVVAIQANWCVYPSSEPPFGGPPSPQGEGLVRLSLERQTTIYNGERPLPFPVTFYFLYSIRMEFSTHSIATPESANTASHMLA